MGSQPRETFEVTRLTYDMKILENWSCPSTGVV